MARRKDHGPDAGMADIMRQATERQFHLVTREEMLGLTVGEIRQLHMARLRRPPAGKKTGAGPGEEVEGTGWQLEPAIAGIKELHPPDGTPKKRTTNKAMLKQLNKLPRFQEKPIKSEETVRQARLEIKKRLGQK
jgi:hypothetical protein